MANQWTFRKTHQSRRERDWTAVTAHAAVTAVHAIGREAAAAAALAAVVLQERK